MTEGSANGGGRRGHADRGHGQRLAEGVVDQDGPADINILTESADNQRLPRLLAGERDLGAAGR